MISDTDLREMQNTRPSFWSRKYVTVAVAVAIVLLLFALICGYYFINCCENDSKGLGSHQSDSWFDAVCSTEASCPSGYVRSPLILISLDGFAARYLDRNRTPSLQRLVECGSSPKFMSPVFPTKTFPNHYSIATGLYPSAHGIVDNTMYDPLFNRTFRIESQEARNSSWWAGEPIWLTAKRQGLKTASFFWPGTDVVGLNAELYRNYSRSYDYFGRVDAVLQWLDLPTESRPDFITTYFEEPDFSGHKLGADTPALNVYLSKADDIISRLMEGLHRRDLLGCVNLVIVSDHGMADVDCKKVVYLDKLVSNFSIENAFFVGGTVGRLRPFDATAENENEQLLHRLKEGFQCKSPQVWVYDASDFPVRWEYRDNRRIDPLLFDVETKWLIAANKNSLKYCDGGDHGYDNADSNMSAIFIASGPAFKKNYTLEPFLNIQVYPLLAEVLGVEPAPNNGTKGALSDMLRTTTTLIDVPERTSTLKMCAPKLNETTWHGACLSTGPAYLQDYTVRQEIISVEKSVLGMPIVTDGHDTDTCILPGTQYVTGFSLTRKSPLWTMFTFRKIAPYHVKNASDIHWSNDPRIRGYEQSPSCFRYQTDELRNEGILQVSLLPEFVDGLESNIITMAVPMYGNFYSDVWVPFWLKVVSWASNFHEVNAITGPLSVSRDFRTEIPTHYFVILTHAVRQDDTGVGRISTTAFVIPHRRDLPKCWDFDRYLRKHRASVETIESKTGLRFYSDLPEAESLRLRLQLVQTSTPFPFQ